MQKARILCLSKWVSHYDQLPASYNIPEGIVFLSQILYAFVGIAHLGKISRRYGTRLVEY
jgi:hypothetical protein